MYKQKVWPKLHTCHSIYTLSFQYNCWLISVARFHYANQRCFKNETSIAPSSWPLFMLVLVKRAGSHAFLGSLSSHGWLVQSWITDYCTAVTEAQVSKLRRVDRWAEAVVSQAENSPSAGFKGREQGLALALTQPGVSPLLGSHSRYVWVMTVQQL